MMTGMSFLDSMQLEQILVRSTVTATCSCSQATPWDTASTLDVLQDRVLQSIVKKTDHVSVIPICLPKQI